MNVKQAYAPGKIILSGEYAVVFGHKGLAIPSSFKIEVSFEERKTGEIEIEWTGIKGDEKWNKYLRNILDLIQQSINGRMDGQLKIKNQLPLGKGMGSSTALVIALSKCFLGEDCKTEALAIEDKVNPGHSGIDFNVIWENQPLIFQKGKILKHFDLPPDILEEAVLVDTGKPNETTKELVAWVKKRSENEKNVRAALETIGKCTERIISGEPIKNVIPAHHRAQIALGVVPKKVQDMITEIEKSGSVAKVIGAGGRTGGGGMVLASHNNKMQIQRILVEYGWMAEWWDGSQASIKLVTCNQAQEHVTKQQHPNMRYFRTIQPSSHPAI